MKVKVRKLTFAQRVAERMAEWHEKKRAEEHEREMIIKRLVELRPENAEERLEADAKWRQYESQQKTCDQLEREYYALFPDDPPMCYSMEVDNTPAFDPFIMTDMYQWAIEHKQHWYDWPELPEPYTPDFNCKWRNLQHDTQS